MHRAGVGELDCVPHQVHEYLPQPDGIGANHLGQWVDIVCYQADVFLVGADLHQGEHLFNDPAGRAVGTLDSELVGLDFREIEDVVDNRQQAFGVAVYRLQMFAAGIFRHVGRHQEFGESYDGGQRRANFMGDVGQELALCAVGRFGSFLGIGQLQFGLLPLGYVSGHGGGGHDPAVADQGNAAQLTHYRASVLGDELVRGGGNALAVPEAHSVGHCGFDVIRCNQVQIDERLSDQFIGAVAEDPLDRRRNAQESKLVVEGADYVRRVFEVRAILLFAFSQFLFGPLGLFHRSYGFRARGLQLTGPLEHLLVESLVPGCQFTGLLGEPAVFHQQGRLPASHGAKHDNPTDNQQGNHQKEQQNLGHRRTFTAFQARRDGGRQPGGEFVHAVCVNLFLCQVLFTEQEFHGLLGPAFSYQVEGFAFHTYQFGVGLLGLGRRLVAVDGRCQVDCLGDGQIQLGLDSAIALLPVGIPGHGGHSGRHGERFVEIKDFASKFLEPEVTFLAIGKASDAVSVYLFLFLVLRAGQQRLCFGGTSLVK